MSTPQAGRIHRDAPSTLAKLVEAHTQYALAWQEHLARDRQVAETHASDRSSSRRVRAQWRKRLEEILKQTALINALLTYAMYRVGKDAAKQLQREYSDDFAQAVARGLRRFHPSRRSN